MPNSSHDLPQPIAALIGARIKELRKKRGLSLRKFNEETGIAQNTLRAWEAGDRPPSLAMALYLVDLFELCSIEELIGGTLGTTLVRTMRRDLTASP